MYCILYYCNIFIIFALIVNRIGPVNQSQTDPHSPVPEYAGPITKSYHLLTLL